MSFGFLVPGKGIEEAPSAVALLRTKLPGAKLVFAGEAGMDLTPFTETANELNVVLGTGLLSEADYLGWTAAADAGLQLRVGLPGGISAALQDCIGAGLPTVASRDLADNINAPAYVARVADTPNPEEIAAALETCLTQAAETGSARAAYCDSHSMAAYAGRLLDMILG